MIVERKKIAAILFPFVLAILIAYILNPIVVFLISRGIKRAAAVSLIYFILIGSIIVALIYIIPVLLLELNKLIETIPFYTKEAQHFVNELKKNYRNTLPTGVQDIIDRNINRIEKILLNTLQNIMNIIMGWFSGLFSFILGPILGFYILKDLDDIKKSIAMYLPASHRERILHWLKSIDTAMGRYIRSQLIVSFIIGMLTAAALYILRVDFALLIGVLAGITNIIPYFGPFIGALPAVAIALLRYPEKIPWVIFSIIIIQQIESGIISPHIVGEHVGLHPITVIFSLLVGGTFFGIWGLVFAVPAAALVKLLLMPTLENLQHK
jgi:predicted PurR-regulated permease PerM